MLRLICTLSQDKRRIPGLDFARSLVASASISDVNRLLDRVRSDRVRSERECKPLDLSECYHDLARILSVSFTMSLMQGPPTPHTLLVHLMQIEAMDAPLCDVGMTYEEFTSVYRLQVSAALMSMREWLLATFCLVCLINNKQ